jgi:hypothetical protein
MTRFTSNAKIREYCRHQPPSGPEIVAAHERVRKEFEALSVSMNDLLPECPEKTVLLRHLRLNMSEANAIIAVEQRLFPLAYDPQPAADA